MSMTDADLCKVVLGLQRLTELEGNVKRFGAKYCKAYMVYPDGVHRPPPDFAHNIEAAFMLARATERKYGCLMTLCSYFLRGGTKGRAYDMVFRFPSGPENTVLGPAASEPESAIRAAVVNVAEAHAAKGDTDGDK